eukprot:jgi/Chlat1/7934/Chrsp68S07366
MSGLEVIGAGLGRTGTMSLKAALQQLGFGPCYHMLEVFMNPGHAQKWIECAQKVEKGQDVDFNKIYMPEEKGRPAYKSAVDHPTATYYEQIMKQYPNSKVILTVRDSPELWYASARSTIYEHTQGHSLVKRAVFGFVPFFRRFVRMVDMVVWKHPRLFDGRFLEEGHAVAVYKRWVEEVKARVPADRLLVFNLKEGWDPLCRFLNVPVPVDTDGTSKPFPRINERAQFRARVAARERAVWKVATVVGACIGVVMWRFTKS